MVERIDLTGEQVSLRPTNAADRSALIGIRATGEVRRWWHGDDLEREFDEGLGNEAVTQLTIETHDQKIVGMIQFAEEDDSEYRHASLDIYIDPSVARRGYASDAIRQLANFLFDDRGHHRLTIDPATGNTAAISCYASVGFKTVGLMRSYELQPDGTWSDGLLMEMLASDRRREEHRDPLEFVHNAEPTAKTSRLPPRWFIRLIWQAHRGLYWATGGRLGLRRPKPNGWGIMRLTTIGRRTGLDRSVMVGYFEDGPNLVTMAMNGWGEDEPAWWLNLQAHPKVHVSLADGPRLVVGRAAHSGEREGLWARWREIDKDLDTYAERRSTETAVVVLEPLRKP